MLNVTCLKLVFRGKHVRNPVVLPTHWWYTVTEAQFSLLQSTQQVLNKSTVHDQNRWARGECLPALSGRLPEVKVHPPCRFHGARDSVRGIKDAASWRMARLLLLLGRRMGGGGLSFCTYGSRDQARVLMYAVVIVPAQFTGGCQRGLCHKCDEDATCCDKRSQIQHIHTELMKQVCLSAWACVRIQSCVMWRRDSVIRC